MAEHNIKFYTIDGISIGKEIGLGGRINTILQAAFFKLANIIPVEEAVKYMKDAATASYSKKGEAIVAMNHTAIDRGLTGLKEIKVPESWKNAQDEAIIHKVSGDRSDVVDFVNNILAPVNAQQGNDLPVSAFANAVDGTLPQGSSAFEKRGIAVDVPEWNPENCIQCNFCSYVCPHAVIRPVAMNADDSAKAPEGMKRVAMTGLAGYEFAMTVSSLDCMGCGSCANVCPGKKGAKALVMKPLETQLAEQKVFEYGLTLDVQPEVAEKFKDVTVKGSQFNQPLLEFSGACAGCGETPYAKLVTQLFGDRMFISNATGCSSIWGGSYPSTPYTVNKEGHGPAWANSLFEDNAEYGYGMYLAQQALRERVKNKVEALAASSSKEEVKAAAERYLTSYTNGRENAGATRALVRVLESCNCAEGKDILKDKEFLSKKSQWIFGGDGWAYDIGFGGLDHVIASGQDVNILVFDTEIYSNTGGQSSKATPTGAIAQFAAAGKEVKKKDLAAIAMSYGYVYVAQIAMGADYNQTMKALVEAESYNGPSIVIAYAPCINHGIKGGMGVSQTEEKNAVTSGYWNTFRFDPRVAEEGKNPFQLDSKAPSTSYQDFIKNEVRYSSLVRQNPERAEQLFASAEKSALAKYDHLVKLSKLYEVDAE
jgi:pyruvate-ferredoxin/flavodoxin oxidoreductase